jgi:hypothetical protein
LVSAPAAEINERRFRLALPDLPTSHAFTAWLVLPRDFPTVRARIELAHDAILRVPHVDARGELCFSGDVGPSSSASPVARLEHMLECFMVEFFVPWIEGKLDAGFEKETANYWAVYVKRHSVC